MDIKIVKIEIENLPRELRKKGLKEKLARICRENDIVFMAVFGSFVKGKQKKKSDIDTVIEFDENSGKTLLDLIRIEGELSKIFGKRVDLGIFSSLSPHIIEDVKKRDASNL